MRANPFFEFRNDLDDDSTALGCFVCHLRKFVFVKSAHIKYDVLVHTVALKISEPCFTHCGFKHVQRGFIPKLLCCCRRLELDIVLVTGCNSLLCINKTLHIPTHRFLVYIIYHIGCDKFDTSHVVKRSVTLLGLCFKQLINPI